MKAKKSSAGAQNHEYAMESLTEVSSQCDPSISACIKAVHAQTTNRHAWDAPLSLRKLVREQVDPVVSIWLKKYYQPEFSLSQLLDAGGTGQSTFFDWLNESIEAEHGEYTYRLFPDLAPTCTALLDFSSFCCVHGGNDEQVIEVVTEKSPGKAGVTRLDVKRAKSLGPEKFTLPPGIVFTHSLVDEQLCELCANLTEAAQELIRIDRQPVQPEVSKKVADLMLRNARVRVRGYSHRFCAKHSPTESPTSYAEASESRAAYGAMRRLMIFARRFNKVLRLNDPDHILRSASFAVVDQCPNRELVEAVLMIVVDWYESWQGLDHDEAPLAMLMGEVVQSFKSIDHPLFDLVQALYSGSGEEVYDAAMKCGVHSVERQQLIDSGFLFSVAAI